jgi:sec-independent protein translocase protein TatA
MLAFLQIGPMEICIIGLLGLLIFGNRLPEVGKSLGRGIVEFKKGISGVSDQIESAGKSDTDTESKKLNT